MIECVATLEKRSLLGPNIDLIGNIGSRFGLQTPALIVDLSRLERNIAKMAGHCRVSGIALRPHTKTHKSVDIARLQIAAGANGVCTATLGEAEIMADGGIDDILITTPAVGTLKIARLINLVRRAPKIMIVADSLKNVDDLSSAARSVDVSLQVVVALDVGLHRVGAATPGEAISLARRIADSPALTFQGVHAYAGMIQHILDFSERNRRASEVHDILKGLVDRLHEIALPPGFVSGGGTGTFNIDSGSGIYSELQAGSYIFCDVEYDSIDFAPDDPRPFEPSLFVRTTVVSANHSGFVTTDAGTKRFSMGGALPRVSSGAPLDSVYGFLGDEHGRLSFLGGANAVSTGQSLELRPPHCDPTINLYNVLHVVRDDMLVDIWPVSARGAI